MRLRYVLTGTLAVAAIAGSTPQAVCAAEPSDQAPIPEPILTESVTDIDAREGGEVELELNGSSVASRRGSARSRTATLEVEWRILPRLGVRLEPGFEWAAVADAATHRSFEASAGVAYGLVQDFERDFHLQVEGVARTFDPETAFRDAPYSGDAVLPFELGLRSALRTGRWTIRPGAAVEAGGAVWHIPLRASLALLTGIGSADARSGFFGVEVDVDGGRRAPFVIAPNVAANCAAIGLPFRLGVAVPWMIGADDRVASFGVFVRLFVESDREIAYAGGKR